MEVKTCQKADVARVYGGGVSSFSLLLLGFSRFGGKSKEISSNHCKSSAFTLAEVLITLGIIGVVAAMTLPTLVQNYKDKQAVTQLKKTYSILSQVWQTVKFEYGEISEWNLAPNSGMEDMVIDRFAKHLKYSKICHIKEIADCMPHVMYKSSTGKYYAEWYKGTSQAALKLSDGTILMTNINDSYVLQFYIDINGAQKPNKLGDDFFYFYIYPNNKLIPGGWYADPAEKQKVFVANCLNNNGYYCANWVIENGNRDYLKCKDLSYDGKTKCK